MGICNVSLRNFKCFESIDLELSKITLLTGKNSSGKSSFMDALLAIFQSEYPFHLSTNGKYVDMGDFSEIAFNYDKKREICLDISLGESKKNIAKYETRWTYEVETEMPVLNEMHIKAMFSDVSMKKIGNQYILNMIFDEKQTSGVREELQKRINSIFGGLVEALAVFVTEGDLSEIKSRTKRLMTLSNIRDMSIKNIQMLENELLTGSLGGAGIFLFSTNQVMKKEGENTNYIGPFRIAPERIYSRNAKAQEKVNKYGENCVNQLLDWKDKQSDKYENLIEIFRELKLLREIKFVKSSSGRFEPRIKINKNGVWSSLVDVGFGISQLLPIIVADLQLSDDSTLLIAQPEMHIHPSGQADLAEYFVRQIMRRNKKYILETHSEYMLNRIRSLIVKGGLKSEDVSLFYFENSANSLNYYKIDLTKDGQVLGAPDEFFNTYQMEIMDIAKNI